MIRDGLDKLPGDLAPRDLVDVANVARAVSTIRARPKPKEERDLDALIAEIKNDPELMAELGLGAPPLDQRHDERGDDDDETDE